MKLSLTRLVIFITTTMLSLVLPCYPQAKDDPQGMKNDPVYVIVFNVTGPDGINAKAKVIEGGSLDVGCYKTGKTYAFFPVVNKKNDKVLMKIYNVIKTDSLDPLDRFQEVEQIEIPVGASSKSMATSPQFNIEVKGIRTQTPKSAQQLKLAKDAENVAAKSKSN